MTVKVLLMCAMAGAVCGISDGTISTLLRRKHIVFTVISDIALAFLLVGSHVLISYLYCDGQFFPYAIFGQVAGFLILRIAANKLTLKAVAALSPRINKMRLKRKEKAEERKRRKLALTKNAAR